MSILATIAVLLCIDGAIGGIGEYVCNDLGLKCIIHVCVVVCSVRQCHTQHLDLMAMNR